MPGSEGLRGAAINLPDGGPLPEHAHSWDQLAYAVEGVMTVVTARGHWVVPPQRAVWLPAHFIHRIEAGGRLAMRSVYFPPGVVRSLPRCCCVVGVPPLLRELVLEFVNHPLVPRTPTRRRVEALLVDMLSEVAQEPLVLPMPEDPRARRVAELLARRPQDRRPLAELAREVGASTRTLQRCFISDAGMSFRQWRRQLRLHHALLRLAEGDPVTSVALQVGYDSPSAFVVMFREALGTTPGRYFKSSGVRSPGPFRVPESPGNSDRTAPRVGPSTAGSQWAPRRSDSSRTRPFHTP